MIRAFADGSATLCDRPAFIGVAVFRGSVLVDEASAHVGDGSNIYAELKAIQVAASMVRRQLVSRAEHCLLYSDSLWSIEAIGGRYRVGPVHEALVGSIREILREMVPGLELRHVKGHAGAPANELVDWLASEARRTYCLTSAKERGSRRMHALKKRPSLPDNEDLLAQPKYNPRRRELATITCREPPRK